MRVYRIGEKMLYNIKIVYTGLPLAGKTSNLRILADIWNIETAVLTKVGERTIYFDHFSKKVIDRGNKIVRVSAYSVPGQMQYRTIREKVMEDMDIMVFVVDLDPARITKNFAAYKDVRDIVENIHGRRMEDLTTVLQYNKADIATKKSRRIVAELRGSYPVVDTVARRGIGVMDTFLKALNLFLKKHDVPIKLSNLDVGERSVLYNTGDVADNAIVTGE